MGKSFSPNLRPLLIEIAAKHHLRLPDAGIRYLVERDRELLIDALLLEFSQTGLDSDDEPNQRGIEIEEIIDFVGSLADQSDATRG